MPDVGIEDETRDGEPGHLDREVATGHNRGRNLTEKVRAEFSLCARADYVSKLWPILDERESMAGVLSL